MSAIQFHDEAQSWRRSLLASQRSIAGAAGLLTRLAHLLWHGRSVRSQVLATFLVINIIAAGATAAIVIFNAKRATEVEIAASVATAERLVRASVDDLGHTIPGGLMLEDLLTRIGPMRHVRLLISTPNGKPVWLARLTSDGGDGKDHAAPRWFAAMINVDDLRREVPVVSSGVRIGTILVLGDPRDEIAEVWADMSSLGAMGLAVDLGVILILYFAFGRVLTPLSALSDGLRQLEEGRFRHRLPVPKTKELAGLAHRFNALAGSLGLARTENLELHRRLIEAQDDERRLIARELHDELGPCLFGLKANLGSLDRIAGALPPNEAARARERTAILAEIADRLQTVNRRLLQRLRPMALGAIPLVDAISALIPEFAQHENAPHFRFHPAHLAESYGDCVDLTVYRCLQEGLTNVVRHARAQVVDIRIEETPYTFFGEGEPVRSLQIAIRDDGSGISPDVRLGMGLTGMKERVEALGGRFSISALASGGTRLEVFLPLDGALAQNAGLGEND